MKIAKQLQIKELTSRSDSGLVVNQVNGNYESRDPVMVQYLKVGKAESTLF